MQTSTIKFSQIEDRIDAEYYKPEYLAIYQLLGNKKISKIGDISIKLVNGGTPDIEEGKFYTKGITFLKNGNIKEMEIDYDNAEFISENSHNIRKRSALKKNDVLVTIAGTIGNIAVFDKDIEANINQNICRIVVEDINPYYLAVFLNSKFGKWQLVRHATVQTIQYINNQVVGDLEVFIPPQSFQQKIEKMVKEAQEKRKLADEKYKEAEEILNKELGLKDLDLSTQKTFEAKFSEAEDRFDPKYYQPKYKKIISKLKSQKSKLLSEIVKISNKKLDPTKNPSTEIKYIELANINGSNGIIEDCETYKHWQLPGRARMLIRNGDVLVSSLSGSIDKVGLAAEEYDGQVASTGFFVVNSNVSNSETLFLIFRNKIISGQLERNTRGAIMSAISENEFRNIIIPVLSQSLQQRISSLIQQSFKLRQEAKELIDRAKKEVEEMVENK